jgi:3-oxoacyl-[acyl-carrier-protein] synthase II
MEAGITPNNVDLVNAHATSTPVGDEAEIKCLEKLLGNPKFTDLDYF